MNWVVAASVAVLVLFVLLWPTRGLAEARRRSMYELRWPTLDKHHGSEFVEEVFADLEQLELGVARRHLHAPAWRLTTVHALRRTPEQTWEMKETMSSRQRSRALARREHRKDPGQWAETLATLASEPTWQPVAPAHTAPLEAAYQRFLEEYELTPAGRTRIEAELLEDFDEREDQATRSDPPAAMAEHG
jgi:hypothetical protein